MTADVLSWERSIPPDEPWPGCRRCMFFQRDVSCIAFPQRIPIMIASGDIDHLVMRPGQIGTTVFTPQEDAPDGIPQASRLTASS